jgi:hypothetical protein
MRMSWNVRSAVVCGLTLAGLVLVSGLNSAEARPGYFAAFNGTYPQVKEAARKAKCAVCHVGQPKVNESKWNDYGAVMGKALDGEKNVRDRELLEKVLKKIEKEKGEKKKTFGELLKAGELPGGEKAVEE